MTTAIVRPPEQELLDEHWEIQVDGKWYTFFPYMEIPAGRYKYRRVTTWAQEVWVQ
jgi:hypothetical protein